MIELVISGGQTGVDQAGWRAAKACGIRTGGWMPKGWITENSPKPEFEILYNAQEHFSSNYPKRTWSNVLSADVTIWIGSGDSRGFQCTLKACNKGPRPYFVISGETTAKILADYLNSHDYKIVNIAGNRESISPGIGEKVERFLIDTFRILLEES